MLAVRDYILVDNANKLGKFFLHYGFTYDHPNATALRPCFKIIKEDKHAFDLIPGFQSINNLFYECPVESFYILINSLKSYNDQKDIYISSEMIVFSRDFKTHRVLAIELKSSIAASKAVDIRRMNEFVNAINLYVEAGHDIKDLDDTIYINNFNLTLSNTNSLLYLVNNLKFDFFSNDRNIVGKDNKFWNEIEITQLPQKSYLKALFVQVLSDAKIGAFYYKPEKSQIFVEYGEESSYSKAYGRQKMETDVGMELKIKDTLKFNLSKYYDESAELFAMLRGL